MICRKATFTVSVSAVTLSNAILRLPEHKNPDFVLEKPENKGFRPQKRTKTSILCSKGLKTRVLNGKSAQKSHFCAQGWLPQAQQRCHEPCGVHLAAVRQATDSRNLPRNLPPWRYRRGTTAKSYRRVHTAVCYRRELSPCNCCRAYYREQAATLPAAKTYLPGILPRDESYRAMGPAPSGRVIRM